MQKYCIIILQRTVCSIANCCKNSLRQVVLWQGAALYKKGRDNCLGLGGRYQLVVQFMVDFMTNMFELYGVMGTLLLQRSTIVGPSFSAHVDIIILALWYIGRWGVQNQSL